MISVVIPCFNEEAVLEELYHRVSRCAQSWGDDYEIILVDDGSTDRTPHFICEIHSKDPRWKALTFSRNFGHQTAVSAGIYYSQGDVVAVMDADLQDPPEELVRFFDKWREGYQVVYAIRKKRKESFVKRICYATFYRVLQRIASLDIPLDAGDFCVMDRSVVDVLKAMPERIRFVRGLRSWIGFRQTGLSYERSHRAAGESKYSFPELIRLAMNGILSFSDVPLRLASWIGMFLCLFSLVLIVLLIVWWAVEVPLWGKQPSDVAGWTSIVSLILVLSGLQFLILGVLGQYLARVFNEVHARPPWVIASALGIKSDRADFRVGWYVNESDHLRSDTPHG